MTGSPPTTPRRAPPGCAPSRCAPSRCAPSRHLRSALLAALALAPAAAFPEIAWQALRFAAMNLLALAPAIALGLLVSAAAAASGTAEAVAPLFRGATWRMILCAAAAGAVIPVCGLSVLPLVAALLAAGVPLAPVMAFWLSSPVIDPGIFALTAATLGGGFAVAKLVAAFGIGLLGGGATALLVRRGALSDPLRDTWRQAAGRPVCGGPQGLCWRFWRVPARRAAFRRSLVATGRLMLLWLLLALLAEYLLRRFVPTGWIAALGDGGDILSVPLAALAGAPLYLEGHAALPLARGLVEGGLPVGAAMAFLVAGGITSAWAAIPVYGLVRLPVFLLYLALAPVGASLAGWAAGAVLA